MFAKTIEFEDYNGNKVKNTFYFHLNKSQLIKLFTTEGGYSLADRIQKLFVENNGKEIMDIFERLIKMSYGEKSLDGIQFVKNDEVWNRFYQSEAYSEFFMEVVTDAKKASEFFNGIIPKDISEEIQKIIKEHPEEIPDTLKDYLDISAVQPS